MVSLFLSSPFHSPVHWLGGGLHLLACVVSAEGGGGGKGGDIDDGVLDVEHVAEL